MLRDPRKLAQTQWSSIDEVASVVERLYQYSESVHWLITPDFKRIIYISPAYEKVWGRAREHLYENAELWVTYLHPEDAKQRHPLHQMKKKIEQFGLDATFSETYRIVRPDDEIRWIIDKGFPIPDDTGKCCGIISTAFDITKHKLAQATLQADPPTNFKAHLKKDDLIQKIREEVCILLTPREIECLALWIGGCSAKKSAGFLQLSHRTIEDYKQSIKDKMDIYDKYQLIEIIQNRGATESCLSLNSLLKTSKQ